MPAFAWRLCTGRFSWNSGRCDDGVMLKVGVFLGVLIAAILVVVMLLFICVLGAALGLFAWWVGHRVDRD